MFWIDQLHPLIYKLITFWLSLLFLPDGFFHATVLALSKIPEISCLINLIHLDLLNKYEYYSFHYKYGTVAIFTISCVPLTRFLICILYFCPFKYCTYVYLNIAIIYTVLLSNFLLVSLCFVIALLFSCCYQLLGLHTLLG